MLFGSTREARRAHDLPHKVGAVVSGNRQLPKGLIYGCFARGIETPLLRRGARQGDHGADICVPIAAAAQSPRGRLAGLVLTFMTAV